MKASGKTTQTNNSKGSGSGTERDRKTEGGGNCNRKPKQATKKPNGLKTVMLVLIYKEKTNKDLIAALKSV